MSWYQMRFYSTAFVHLHWQSQVTAYYLFHLYCPDFAVACRYILMYMHVCVSGCECVVYFGQQQLNPNVAQCLPRRADPGAISHFNDSTELALLLLPLPLSLPPYASTVCLPLLSCLLHTHAPKWLTTKQQQKKKNEKIEREKKWENKQQLNGIVCRRNDSLIRCRGEVTTSAESGSSFTVTDLIQCQSDRKTTVRIINCLSKSFIACF